MQSRAAEPATNYHKGKRRLQAAIAYSGVKRRIAHRKRFLWIIDRTASQQLRLLAKAFASNAKNADAECCALSRYSSGLQNVQPIDDQFSLCRKLAEQQGWNIVGYYRPARGRCTGMT